MLVELCWNGDSMKPVQTHNQTVMTDLVWDDGTEMIYLYYKLTRLISVT